MAGFEMTPEELQEEKARAKAEKAYNKAMPSPEPGESKPKKMAKGGSASSRADGVASKGKTRGKFL